MAASCSSQSRALLSMAVSRNVAVRAAGDVVIAGWLTRAWPASSGLGGAASRTVETCHLLVSD
jgi:hypothetical protein